MEIFLLKTFSVLMVCYKDHHDPFTICFSFIAHFHGRIMLFSISFDLHKFIHSYLWRKYLKNHFSHVFYAIPLHRSLLSTALATAFGSKFSNSWNLPAFLAEWGREWVCTLAEAGYVFIVATEQWLAATQYAIMEYMNIRRTTISDGSIGRCAMLLAGCIFSTNLA